MTAGKTIALTRWTFVGKVMSLLFDMLSRFVIAFLQRSKCLLISCLQSPSSVNLEPKKIKSVTVSIVSPSICHEVMGPDAVILVFWMLSFKPVFSLSSFTFIKRLFSSSSLSAIRVVSSAYLRLLIFLPVELSQILKDFAAKVWCSIWQQIWKTQLWPQNWKMSVFISIPKKGSAKECSNYCTVVLISYASKVMLKILQAML